MILLPLVRLHRALWEIFLKVKYIRSVPRLKTFNSCFAFRIKPKCLLSPYDTLSDVFLSYLLSLRPWYFAFLICEYPMAISLSISSCLIFLQLLFSFFCGRIYFTWWIPNPDFRTELKATHLLKLFWPQQGRNDHHYFILPSTVECACVSLKMWS